MRKTDWLMQLLKDLPDPDEETLHIILGEYVQYFWDQGNFKLNEQHALEILQKLGQIEFISLYKLAKRRANDDA